MGWQGAKKSAQPSLGLVLPYMPTQGTLANPILHLSCNPVIQLLKPWLSVMLLNVNKLIKLNSARPF